MESHFFQRLILNGGEERAMHAPAHSTSQVRFGDFALDLTSGDLRKDGQKLALPPKAFEVLKALVERPGEVVTREELRARLWAADTFVEFDDSLNHAVNKLRLALARIIREYAASRGWRREVAVKMLVAL
jgi:DNA-binding winged helix-turn-helix (wHTH) protein